MQASRLAEWEKYLLFQTFSDPALELALSKAKDFCCDFRDHQPPHLLTILGSTGTGKTYLMNQVWKKLWHKCNWAKTSFHPHKVYWPDFVSQLKNGGAFDKFNEMKNWPMLFLDDIGAERDTTGFSSDKLNELMGCRMNKWTLITSNLLLPQLGGIDPRIADRVIRRPNKFIEVKTVSYSLRQHRPVEVHYNPSDL
jgi:DNA replication protein DnaC